MSKLPAIWFPTVRTGTGTDVFTERLVTGLRQRGLRAEISWLPLHAEYAPWTVPIPQPPAWATVAHVNTWLHSRFLPKHLPFVATIHHAVHHPVSMPYKGTVRAAYHRFWIAPNERSVIRHANRVVAVSQFVADTSRQTLLDVPMQVIYNGVDTDLYQPNLNLKKPNKPFRLLFVGSWMARKGVDLLAPIMRELGDEFVLYYTGGPAAEKDKAGMPANMHDIGRLNGDKEVIKEMQNADALLLPSRSEGHPLVGIEAMACGLPIIGMHGSSVTEVVSDGQTGLMCPSDDVAAFVAAIRALPSDVVHLAAMAQAARINVVTRFSEKTMTDSYALVYQALLTEYVVSSKKLAALN